jgi:acetyl esterase/lipase
MTPDLRTRIAALGCDLTMEMMGATQVLFAERFAGFDPAVQVTRDLEYGSHERHRLDIFRKAGTAGAPVLVYVHGGGFVMGDKRGREGSPFYDNVGDFAARSGMVGVTITYRLAPGSTWPAGPEDLAAVVAWLRDNIAEHGGDSERIVLMGSSAGAVHVASYVAHPRFHAAANGGVAGAVLLSCIYDVAAAHANQFHKAYYGEDTAAYPPCSTAEGLIASTVPLLMTVSEFDIPDFQKQAAALVADWGRARGGYAPMLYLPGHNHISPAQSLGSSEDALARELLDFIAAL